MSQAPVQLVTIPDLGDFNDMPVIEISVRPGDLVAAEQTLLMVESDKATMDIPSPMAGRVVELKVALGEKVNVGTLIAIIEPLADLTKSAPEPLITTAQVILPVPEAPPAREPALPADAHADFLVIGAGPGGYTAAFRAADLGRKVTSSIVGMCSAASV